MFGGRRSYDPARMDTLEDDVAELKKRHNECDLKHEQSEQHRRRIDDKMQESIGLQKSTDDTLKAILLVLESSIPTIQRSKDTYTTIDTLKSWALWIAAISGAVVVLFPFIDRFVLPLLK